ncbi:hypothetical protein CDL12_05376 [Handroanthus impetiginosus]|uniref:SBP-type domain-containing protein n=1 Tax=Handroanthus impetiginosus TaxID=429701 RepID=A0A2G9HWM9_9LAMI|nr:hypothetical protein CDL12_05376 [Handroanthus impetiginosus]
MEYYWTTLFDNSTSSDAVRGHNGNYSTHHAWESWDLASSSSDISRVDCSYTLHKSLNYTTPPSAAAASSAARQVEELNYYKPDPHLMCLKLGKRHYFEDFTNPPAAAAEGRSSTAKKGKLYCATQGGRPSAATVADAAPVVVPRCQVEGCEVVLVNAKDYHRRHKVCEMHAKAPKVVVLGIEQRFCQQCSRFHGVGEFDESKRSCRRRLAGHNERRRKSSQDQHSFSRKPHQDIKMAAAVAAGGRHPHFLNSSECALSLLSSTNYNSPWNFSMSPDLPARCSAALRDLIAENRASILACRQLVYPCNNNHQIISDFYNNNNNNSSNTYKLGSIRPGSYPHENGSHVTLDLMQAPNSTFGLLSVNGHSHKSSKEGDEDDCSELWKVPLGY